MNNNQGETLKHLTITYNGVTLWDAPVGSLDWQDSDNGVKVEGRVRAAPKGGAGGGLLDMLTGMSKTKTAQVAAQKRENYEAEIVEPEPVEPEPVEPEPVEAERADESVEEESVGR